MASLQDGPEHGPRGRNPISERGNMLKQIGHLVGIGDLTQDGAITYLVASTRTSARIPAIIAETFCHLNAHLAENSVQNLLFNADYC